MVFESQFGKYIYELEVERKSSSGYLNRSMSENKVIYLFNLLMFHKSNLIVRAISLPSNRAHLKNKETTGFALIIVIYNSRDNRLLWICMRD